MHGMHANYWHLHDLFPEEDNDDGTLLSIEEVYMIIAGDELTSLKEVQNSPEWPEWQQAMAEELELLEQMGIGNLYPNLQMPFQLLINGSSSKSITITEKK